MRARPLGSHGPTISVIGYGGWEAGGRAWGPPVSDKQVVAAMRSGFDAGINWVDTAEAYGDGHSEELIGKAIRRRAEVMVFTKVASRPRGTGYDRAGIRRAVQASLRRLDREFIDLYQVHWPDEREASLEETWGAMADLVDTGMVRWIGVSNFTADLIERCERIRHVDVLQPHLSMLWQERVPLLETCLSNGTGVIAYGSLAFGLLTGRITRDTTFPDDDWRSGKHGLRAYEQLFAPTRFEANLDVTDSLRPIADRLAISLPQLAIAWVLAHEGVTGAIIGSRSEPHVRENAEASSVILSPRDLADIRVLLEKRGELNAS